MICANCGANNPPASAYCGGCGSFLGAAPDVATRGSAPQGGPPPTPEPAAPASQAAPEANDDMPTFHTTDPAAEPTSSESGVENLPTARVASEQFISPVDEVKNADPAAPRSFAQPASPTPNFAQSAPQAQAPWPAAPAPTPSGYPSGALYPPQQGQPVPGYPSGVYPPQQGQPIPGYPSGALYPLQQGQPVPGYPSGVYPPQTPLPVPGAYPPQTPLPTPGAYPPQTPLPGYPSGVYPAQGQPSGAYPPTVGGFPPGVYSTPYPGQISQPAWGAYPGPVAPQPAKPSRLINPMPLWAFIASIVIVAALLLLLTFFAGSDWAAGAQTAGVVALVIGVLILIAFGVRAGLGMLVQSNPHRRSQILSALLLTLLLIAVGAVGLTQQTGMHNFQAHTLEGQQKWQLAVNEYEAGGQGAPNSEDIARTYNEWGEQLVKQGKTSSAIQKFDLVYTTYNQAPTGLAQAKKDAISAYQGAAEQATQSQDYLTATRNYDALLAEPYCQNDSSCQSQYGSDDATAYYKLAEQKLSTQPPDYAAAVAAFNKLTTNFGNSSQSKSAHADYAKALLGDGQQMLNTTCSSALPLYQQLASQFSDTPQGQQATTALKQSEPVKGQFTSNIPGGNDVPVVALVQGITPGMTSDQFYPLLDKSPATSVNSDGSFVFKPVKQGNYFLVWGTVNQTAGQEIFSVSQQYPAAVGPLCTLDMGQINESFPKA